MPREHVGCLRPMKDNCYTVAPASCSGTALDHNMARCAKRAPHLLKHEH